MFRCSHELEHEHYEQLLDHGGQGDQDDEDDQRDGSVSTEDEL